MLFFCGKPMFGHVTYAYAYLEESAKPIYSMVQKFDNSDIDLRFTFSIDVLNVAPKRRMLFAPYDTIYTI